MKDTAEEILELLGIKASMRPRMVTARIMNGNKILGYELLDWVGDKQVVTKEMAIVLVEHWELCNAKLIKDGKGNKAIKVWDIGGEEPIKTIRLYKDEGKGACLIVVFTVPADIYTSIEPYDTIIVMDYKGKFYTIAYERAERLINNRSLTGVTNIQLLRKYPGTRLDRARRVIQLNNSGK